MQKRWLTQPDVRAQLRPVVRLVPGRHNEEYDHLVFLQPLLGEYLDADEKKAAALFKKNFTHCLKVIGLDNPEVEYRRELDPIARYRQRFPDALASEATPASAFLTLARHEQQEPSGVRLGWREICEMGKSVDPLARKIAQEALRVLEGSRQSQASSW